MIVADPARQLVFVPTSSPNPDYFGGGRAGHNLFANSVVALHAETGARVWHFQTVHHDLWDYDVASPPVLFDWRKDGRTIPAVGVASKTGHLFVLDRATGVPLIPVEERAVPKSDVPGEEAAPTQPFPSAPRSLARVMLKADDAWGRTDDDRAWCRETMRALRSEGIFTPPSLQGTLVVPGNISTPMTYLARDGRQYVVISAGGHGTPAGPPIGDYVVAFALPGEAPRKTP